MKTKGRDGMTLRTILHNIDFDAELDEKGLIKLIDLQGEYLGNIEEERYTPDQDGIQDILDRMEIYWNDYCYEPLAEDLGVNNDLSYSDLYQQARKKYGKEVDNNTIIGYIVNPERVRLDDEFCFSISKSKECFPFSCTDKTRPVKTLQGNVYNDVHTDPEVFSIIVRDSTDEMIGISVDEECARILQSDDELKFLGVMAKCKLAGILVNREYPSIRKEYVELGMRSVYGRRRDGKKEQVLVHFSRDSESKKSVRTLEKPTAETAGRYFKEIMKATMETGFFTIEESSACAAEIIIKRNEIVGWKEALGEYLSKKGINGPDMSKEDCEKVLTSIKNENLSKNDLRSFLKER